MEFVYFLISREIEEINNSDSEEAIRYLGKQEAFLETHLGAWVSEFAENVRKRADTAFYRNLANATESFVKKDIEALRELLSVGSEAPITARGRIEL